MLSLALRAVSLSILVGLPAAAQSDPTIAQRARPIVAPVRDAGIYHLATGTWTRKSSQAAIGIDVIYDNTCSSPYYSPLTVDTFVDEGRIPSPSGPTDLQNRPGTQTSYAISGFQIAYCTDQPTMGAYNVAFFESYAACTSVIGVTPAAAFALTGLPGGGTAGACWIVTIDLDSPPQTASLVFPMQADGDGTYNGPSTNDLFGWSMSSTTPGTATGPIIAGDFNTCLGYDGTRWDSVVNYAEAGTGMSSLDQFRIESGATPPGCYFFGGNPFASFHLELYSTVCSNQLAGTIFCCGNGSGTQCPCGNNSVPVSPGNCGGCNNSLGLGGRLRGTTGTPCGPPIAPGPSISNDTVTLFGNQMPNASALYFQGTTQLAGGAGIVFGDGLRCAGGVVIRLGTKTNVAGASQYPGVGDLPVSVKGGVTLPGVRMYQVWYRNAAAFCTTSTFNLTNGYQIAWGP
jgi:hypothetical protein